MYLIEPFTVVSRAIEANEPTPDSPVSRAPNAALISHGCQFRNATRPYDPQHPIHLGSRSTWGEIPILLNPQDARFHTYNFGKTGSEKTTLLKNLIAQHIH
jgi:DNA helicase HerA-like ATPase